MKFKKFETVKRVTIKCAEDNGDEMIVETLEDGPGLFVSADGIFLTRAKALKLAWAIINELNPSAL